MKLMWLDEYERHARLVPGLLVLVPVALVAVGIGFAEYPQLTAFAGVIVALGGPVVLASVVRDRGLALQSKLFASWGGPPTTQLLRLSGPDPDRTRRRSLTEDVTGISLPTAPEEADDPGLADAQYEAAVRDLRNRTYNRTEYPLVFAENKNYGFARNMRAMRPWGLTMAALGMIAAGSVVAACTIAGSSGKGTVLGPLLATICCAVCLLGWYYIPSEAWVRRAADRYAEQLISALPRLGSA